MQIVLQQLIKKLCSDSQESTQSKKKQAICLNTKKTMGFVQVYFDQESCPESQKSPQCKKVQIFSVDL